MVLVPYPSLALGCRGLASDEELTDIAARAPDGRISLRVVLDPAPSACRCGLHDGPRVVGVDPDDAPELDGGASAALARGQAVAGHTVSYLADGFVGLAHGNVAVGAVRDLGTASDVVLVSLAHLARDLQIAGTGRRSLATTVVIGDGGRAAFPLLCGWSVLARSAAGIALDVAAAAMPTPTPIAAAAG